MIINVVMLILICSDHSCDVVLRYLGDEEEESDSIRESHAQRLLARLQSKAKEREQRETSPTRAKKRPAAESGETQEKPKKKKKKVKPTEKPEVPEPVKEEQPAGDKEKDGKKKKKKKNDGLGEATSVCKQFDLESRLSMRMVSVLTIIQL